MNRRKFLAITGSAVATTVTLSGCSEPEEESGEGFEGEGSDGERSGSESEGGENEFDSVSRPPQS